MEKAVDKVMEIMLANRVDGAIALLLEERALQQGLPTQYPTFNIIVRIVASPFVRIVLV